MVSFPRVTTKTRPVVLGFTLYRIAKVSPPIVAVVVARLAVVALKVGI